MAGFSSGSGLSVTFTTHLSTAFTKKEMKHKHVALPPKPYLPFWMGGGLLASRAQSLLVHNKGLVELTITPAS